jgi:hypothetical protein
MIKKRNVKVEVICSDIECGDECIFNDANHLCILFDASIGNSEEFNVRCADCIKNEIKEE